MCRLWDVVSTRGSLSARGTCSIQVQPGGSRNWCHASFILDTSTTSMCRTATSICAEHWPSCFRWLCVVKWGRWRHDLASTRSSTVCRTRSCLTTAAMGASNLSSCRDSSSDVELVWCRLHATPRSWCRCVGSRRTTHLRRHKTDMYQRRRSWMVAVCSGLTCLYSSRERSLPGLLSATRRLLHA